MTIRSMTGFGKAEKEINGKKFAAEIRSLNGKQLDFSVRLPQAYRYIEAEIRQALSHKIGRGKIDMTVSVENTTDKAGSKINAEIFKAYYKKLKDIVSDLGIDIDKQDVVSSIMRFPDIISADADELCKEDTAMLVECCNAAFENLDAYRTKEGGALIEDIAARVETIKTNVDELETFESGRIAAIKAGIKSGLEKLSVEIDKNRFEQELIYYIEKLDITEEKVRLRQHCDYFRNTIACEETPGRKLGFISQEMGREINTIGSKSNDAGMQRIVVGMKDELEKIKEQLLNIL